MNSKRFALFGVASLAVVAAAGLAIKPVFTKTIAECDHSGNHYTALAATANTAGTKEYWVCCSCHEHFFTQPVSGTWKDTGVAGAVDASDDRYVAPIWSKVTACTIEDVEGGAKISGVRGFGARAYVTESLTLDGLSFSMTLEGMVDQLGDCRGFFLHNGAGMNYFTEEPSVTFSVWSLFTQLRGHFAANHDYNGASLCYSDKTGTTAGLSSVAGHLVCNFDANPTYSFSFAKDGTDWYKVEISHSGIWSAHNYNVVEGPKVTTYLRASDVDTDGDGKVYMSVFGLDAHGEQDAIIVKGL